MLGRRSKYGGRIFGSVVWTGDKVHPEVAHFRFVSVEDSIDGTLLRRFLDVYRQATVAMVMQLHLRRMRRSSTVFLMCWRHLRRRKTSVWQWFPMRSGPKDGWSSTEGDEECPWDVAFISEQDGCVISANEATNTLSLEPETLQLVHTVLIFFATLYFSVGFLYSRSETFRNHTHRRKLN